MGQYLVSVSNSASYYDSSMPGYGVAQWSIIVLFGYQLGPAELMQAPGFPMPADLGGTSIKVTVGGVTLNAPIVYTSAGQVAALLPSSTPTGRGTLLPTYKGKAGYPIGINVVASAFGIYSLLSNGLGAGVITTPDYKVKTLADSFRPNDIGVLWGTGLGAVAGDDSAGPLAGPQFPGAEVYVGNQRAKVLYAGRSGCCAGLDQINFEVPTGVQGCFVPIAVRNGGVTSNFVSLPVASGGGPCWEPVGLPADLLRAAQSGQAINVSAVGLGPVSVLQALGFRYSRSLANRLSATLRMKITEKQVLDLMGASTSGRRKLITELVRKGSRNALDRLALLGALVPLAQGFDQQGSAARFGRLAALDGVVSQFGEVLPPPGTCTVYSQAIDSRANWNPRTKAFDAGPELVLSGPLGTRTLSRVSEGLYQTSFGGGFTAGQLPAGRYSVSSIGGADVGPFSASIDVTADLRWTNKTATAVVDRSVPLDVTWSGGASSGYVVFGGSATSDLTGVGRLFACVEDIRQRRFTVPVYVLGALPDSRKGYLFLGTHPLQYQFFAKGLDAGFVADLTSDNREVPFR